MSELKVDKVSPRSGTYVSLNTVGSKNIIINGDMSIAQRSTSVASVATGYNTCDRWNTVQTSLGAFTQSQSTDVPTGQGFATSLKMDCTTADASPAVADRLFIEQKFEGQNLQYLKKGTANAVSTTLSFWVKSNKTGTYIIQLYDVDNNRSISKSYTIDSASTWEKKTITFAGDTTGTLGNDNSHDLSARFYLGVGTNYSSGTLGTSWGTAVNTNVAVGQVNLADSTSNEWYITGVQLEAGTTASDFEFLPYDVNLGRCQRYYYKTKSDAVATLMSSGYNTLTTESKQVFNFPTTMRARPTSVETTGTAGDYRIQHGNSSTVCSAVPSYNNASTNCSSIDLIVASGLTVGQGSLSRTTSADVFFAWSAEL
jgi:hypothetical protein